MIDIHNHSLWQIDDGSNNQESTLEMLKKAKNFGFETVVVTPHIRWGLFNNSHEIIKQKFQECIEMFEREMANIPQIIPGCEYYFDDHLLELVRKKEILTLGENGKYFLTEFPYMSIPLGYERILFEMQVAGFIPVIAHIERYLETQNKIDFAESLFDAGCVLQIDIGSVIGLYGKHAKKCSLRLLELGLCHVLATDAHKPEQYEPICGEALSFIQKKIGTEALQTLMFANQQVLISGGNKDDIQLLRDIL